MPGVGAADEPPAPPTRPPTRSNHPQIPRLSTAARALRFAALYGMLPLPLLPRIVRVGRSRVPLPAIVLQACIIALLMNFGFNVLVVLSVLFYNVAAALQFAAFLRLRYTQPALPRPFTVPGGLAGAWALVGAFYAVLGVSLYASFSGTLWTLPVVGGAQLLFAAGGLAWARWGGAPLRLAAIDLAEASGFDASDPAAADTLASAEAAVLDAAAEGRSDVRAWMQELGLSLNCAAAPIPGREKSINE